MCKQRNKDRTNTIKHKLLLGALCIMLPIGVAQSNIAADADGKDDSEVIIEHIRQSLDSSGLVSVEQYSGRLLFNPKVDKLHSMALKQQFLLPAMLVNQVSGLKLVTEMPFTCFMVSAGELASDSYNGYRQHETIRYIRDVKGFSVSRVLICQPASKSAAKEWNKSLALDEDSEPFVFEEHVSISGEHFYYFLNKDGAFEMYL